MNPDATSPLDDPRTPWPLLLAANLVAMAMLAGVAFGIGLIRDDHPVLAAVATITFVAVMVVLGVRDDTSPASRSLRAPAPRRQVWRPQARLISGQKRTTPPPR